MHAYFSKERNEHTSTNEAKQQKKKKTNHETQNTHTSAQYWALLLSIVCINTSMAFRAFSGSKHFFLLFGIQCEDFVIFRSMWVYLNRLAHRNRQWHSKSAYSTNLLSLNIDEHPHQFCYRAWYDIFTYFLHGPRSPSNNFHFIFFVGFFCVVNVCCAVWFIEANL